MSELVALGYKDHSLLANALDVSNNDGCVTFATYPVWGMYQPDALAPLTAAGEPYLVSANEGNGRAWEGFDEEASVGDDDYLLDPEVFTDATALKGEAKLGGLTVAFATGDTDGDGTFEKIYAFGGRSISIWNASGELVFDSGDTLEQLTAAAYLNFFNATNDEDGDETFDDQSANNGPEPEGVVVGPVGERNLCFCGAQAHRRGSDLRSE